MKKFYILILASVILLGLTAAYVWHCRSAQTEWTARQTENWNLQKQELQAQIDDISAKTEELKPQKTELDIPELKPQALIARFQEMKNWYELFGNKTPTDDVMKKICHDQVQEAYFIFHGLQDQGDKSLDTIREYLNSGHNVILYQYSDTLDPNEYFDPEKPRSIVVSRHKVMPETSRLGLFKTLGNIKTPAALGALCDAMRHSTNFLEITTAANILLVADKDAYAQAILEACKAIYPNSPGEVQNELLGYIKNISKDEYNKLILDPDDFYSEDGKLAGEKLYRRLQTLKEDGIPLAYEIFNRADTSLKDKSNILDCMERILRGYGSNDQIDPTLVEQANSMFISFINGLNNEDKETLGTMALTLYSRSIGAKSNTSKKQQYLNLLNQLPASEEGSIFNGMRDFMNRAMTVEAGSNEEMMLQKELVDSGLAEKFMKNTHDFFKENPDWKDSRFYKNFF
jgi:hypothetical protein